MRPDDSNAALSTHLTRLLGTTEEARMDVAKKMGVADGTLGRIKYGKGNPTLDVLDKIARYYRVPAWELLRPASSIKEEQRGYGPDVQRLVELAAALPDVKRRALLTLLEG